MKIKTLLLLGFVVSFPFFVIYLIENQDGIDIVTSELGKSSILIALLSSTILLLVAHIIRALKTKMLTDTIKKTTWRTHVRALFIGYLFNALLPLRIGELVRAVVLGKGTRMSASFMFGLVVLDRAIDGIILGLIGIGFLLFTDSFNLEPINNILLFSSATLLLLGLLLLSLLVVLKFQPPAILKLWHRFTALFNLRLQDSLRFKMWSAMYGLERTLVIKHMIKYAVVSVLMWGVYLCALLPLASVVTSSNNTSQQLALSTTSYYGIAEPAGPAHIGSYQTFVQPFIDAYNNEESLRNFLALAWLLQVIPAFMVGLLFVIRTKETLARTQSTNKEQLIGDKLLRDVDMTKDLGSFLDAFFTNNSLSRIMHRFEVDKTSKLIHYFKGGSSAITALVYEDDTFLVRKITPIQYKYKLKSQYDWLLKKADLDKIVDVISEETTDSYYKIDLHYNEEFIPYFDFIHSSSHVKSGKILNEVFAYLFDNVYKFQKAAYRPKDLESYLEDRCLSKIRQASEVNDEIRSLLDYETLVINGEEYLNIPQIIDRVRSDKHIKHTLATYRKCSIHGDTTIDNVLASKKTGDFLLIDPTDNENEISGPVFDFGRMTQSLRYGYEFLNRDDQKVDVKGNCIDFEYALSSNYAKLYEELRDIQARYLTSEERSAVTFHAGLLYSRMLTHRVVINPLNAAKYYAVSVMAFNDFINEIDNDKQAN